MDTHGINPYSFALGQTCNRQCRHRQLNTDDTDDCCIEFAEQILSRSSTLHPGNTAMCDAWVRKCAHNHVLNFIRAKSRRQVHETPLEHYASTDAEQSSDLSTSSTNPSTIAIKAELTCVLASSLTKLTEAQQEMIRLRYLEGWSRQEIGDITCRTPHAVSQALVTAKKRLRSLLEANGVTSEGVDEYLYEIHPPHKRILIFAP